MATYGGRGIHGQVVDALGARILSGALSPGDVVDPDAVLREFGVSRTVVREALKVLSAKGLVDARPRTGTFITDRSRWQLLDADVMAWRIRGSVDSLLLLELGEVRQVLEPPAARMAAARRGDSDIAALDDALDRMVAHAATDHEALIQADLDFHRAILLAAGNELLQRFEVILEPALKARDALLHGRPADETFLDAHRAIRDAIAEGGADAAFDMMTQMMTRAAEDVKEVLQSEGPGSEN
ncbi:FadR/GntR family transcriptional regulator [Microbacterium sp. BK668]|uniref:FadR/GntR family transcriptional regulator n=1 Tax=Microbacterium sp. BK668 TaxID=2512118 RepID=UPI00105C1E21|nr:FadR/GntR family transcriptional regulator [Microbacterium sp. BK668]TDN91572.1 GntR family transcriptional regulator [Microbacterium sp. BK668]